MGEAMNDADSNPDAGHLARAVLAHEPDAHGRWFEHEHGAVWKLCFGFLADHDAAADVAQDAMLRLHDHLKDWDIKRPYTSWRNTVVLNMCRDRMRRTAARSVAEDRAAEMGLPDRLPDPAAAACQSEVRAALQAALAGLSPREREVFVLAELEGQPVRDVASALGIGASSVRSLLTLARRRLRDILKSRVPGLCPDAGGGAS
ncbi:MAG: RNA polymerase sigma-70 factor (ECF subfamily) [Chlamydiales bacterium]|jgi:RNA polymerase sigma-70 factor (ECF subfamily)